MRTIFRVTGSSPSSPSPSSGRAGWGSFRGVTPVEAAPTLPSPVKNGGGIRSAPPEARPAAWSKSFGARLGAAILVAAAGWLSLAPAAAQAPSAETPFVPDEWKYGRRQEGSTLQYCLDARDPDLPVARKIGRAIAQALLLEPKPHEIGANTAGEDLDNLYRVFLETCDIHLGFKAIADAYPPWLAVTRPYYRTSYIMVTANAAWTSLADMPRSQALGATIGTSADIRLVQYLKALAPGDRWSRFPMGSDELALRALMRNTIGAALVWAPSFWALRQSDAAFATLRVISLKPLADSTVDVAATLLAREPFLRSNIDQAIAALTADGSIQAILESEKFPAAPVK
jgi:polar amino acid transport system substrate-binding protein